MDINTFALHHPEIPVLAYKDMDDIFQNASDRTVCHVAVRILPSKVLRRFVIWCVSQMKYVTDEVIQAMDIACHALDNNIQLDDSESPKLYKAIMDAWVEELNDNFVTTGLVCDDCDLVTEAENILYIKEVSYKQMADWFRNQYVTVKNDGTIPAPQHYTDEQIQKQKERVQKAEKALARGLINESEVTYEKVALIQMEKCRS